MVTLFKRSTPRFFLTSVETETLVKKVAHFEKAVGCELVFHFRLKLGSSPEAFNKKLFHQFKLDQTSDHRAILVTLALQDKKFAVWADEGVEKHAGRDLHDQIALHLKRHLPEGRHLEALLGVVDVAEKALRSSKSTTHTSNEISDEPIIEDSAEKSGKPGKVDQ